METKGDVTQFPNVDDVDGGNDQFYQAIIGGPVHTKLGKKLIVLAALKLVDGSTGGFVVF